MSEEKYHDLTFKKSSEAEDGNEARMYKSKLFQSAKKAQKIFEYIEQNEGILEEWMKGDIISACEGLEKVCQSLEYEAAYPTKVESLPPEEIDEETQKENNNYLSNEDKRYPVPQEAESGDQFIGRCISDPNMKNRYPEQADRFMACMLIFNSPVANEENNPGKKFEDPMSNEELPIDPDQPILP